MVEDALIMGSDYYETLEECELLPGCMPMGLGVGTTVRRCIIDKNARLGAGVQVRCAAVLHASCQPGCLMQMVLQPLGVPPIHAMCVYHGCLLCAIALQERGACGCTECSFRV